MANVALLPACLLVGHRPGPMPGIFGRWGHEMCGRCGWAFTDLTRMPYPARLVAVLRGRAPVTPTRARWSRSRASVTTEQDARLLDEHRHKP